MASTMHAAGHAALAVAASGCMLALAGHFGLGPTAPTDLAAGEATSKWLADRAFSWSLLGLGVVGVKAIAGAYAAYVQASLAGEVGGLLRLDLLDALLAVHRLRRPRHGDHGDPADGGAGAWSHGISALTERVHDVEQGLHGVLGGARALAQLVPLVVVLVSLSPRTAAAAAAIMAVFGTLLGRARGAFRRAAARATDERAALLGAADEAVRYAELWVSYGAEGKARRRVAELGEAIARTSARVEARAAALSGVNEVLGAAALVLAIGAARSAWLGAATDGATLLAFAVTFFLAYRPVRELGDSRVSIERARAAFVPLSKILDGRASVASEPAVDASSTPRWTLARLEISGLLLARGGCGPVTLALEPGTITVLTGPTGVGKTTLLRTLLGLEGAAAGDVRFGGASIVDAPAGPRARPFAWVPQDAPLVSDTLGANVSLGGLGAGDAPADSPAASLDPLGAGHLAGSFGQARLGVEGRAVSGGERQWIALARAITTHQPILLLDEPTSGLDPDAQRRVLDAVARLRGHRTVLLVTHRAEPASIADHVVRLGPSGAIAVAA